MSINQVAISGNLTRDPELRYTQAQKPVLNFGIAVNENRKNSATGEWEQHPHFVDCVMFGNRAESVSRYLHKGSKVSVSGKLNYRSWEQDGVRRSKLEVWANDIDLMSQPQNATQSSYSGGYSQSAPTTAPYPPQAPKRNSVQAQPQAPVYPADIYDEDIPF